MAKLTKREKAGYFTRKAQQDVTLEDVRQWADAPRFNAEDQSGVGHGVSVPRDDWQRYVAYFKRRDGMGEPEVMALAQRAWEHATARMKWGPIFDLMKKEAARARR